MICCFRQGYIYPRTISTAITAILRETVTSIAQNSDELRVRTPSRINAVCIPAKMHQVIVELPSTLGAVTTLHNCTIFAIGLRKRVKVIANLKNLCSKNLLHFRCKMSTVLTMASFFVFVCDSSTTCEH